MFKWKLYIILTVILVSSPLQALVLEDSSIQDLALLPYLRVVETNEPMALEEFLERAEAPPENGVYTASRKAKFAYLKIVNPTSESRSLVISSSVSYLDHIDFYELDKKSQWQLRLQTGDRDLKQEDRKYTRPIYEFDAKPGENHLLIAVQTTGGLNLDFRLWDEDSFEYKLLAKNTLLTGLLLGFLLVMIGFNFFLWVTVSRLEYLLFSVWISFFTFAQLILSGVFHLVFDASSLGVWLSHQGLVMSAELTGIVGAIFAWFYLNIRETMPFMKRYFQAFFVISSLSIVIVMFDYSFSIDTVVPITNGYISLLLLYVGIRLSFKRFRPAYFYTMAWGSLILGNVVAMLHIYGKLPPNEFAQWGQLVGGALLVNLISIGMGDKIRSEQLRAKENISVLNEQLKESNEALSVKVDELEDLSESLREKNEQIEKESSKRLEVEKKLRLELEIKFELFSHATHHLNNPLNHISGSLGGMNRDIKELENFLEELIGTGEVQDEEVQNAVLFYQKRIMNAEIAGEQIVTATRRAADTVVFLRILSGIDGLSLEPTSWQQIWSRYQMLSTVPLKLEQSETLTDTKRIVGHPAIYAHALDLICSKLWGMFRKPLIIDFVAELKDHHYVSISISGHDKPVDLTSTCEQINYLLASYSARLEKLGIASWRLEIPSVSDAAELLKHERSA